MKYNDEIIETEDGKQWIYDSKHHEWIDVTSNPKLLKTSVRLRA